MLRGVFTPVAGSALRFTAQRNFSCTAKVTLATRIVDLRNAVINSNWSDTGASIVNVPHWEDEYAALAYDLQTKAATVAEKKAYEELGNLFDLYYRAEDVRDHLNEVLEMKSRAGGIAGVGINAGEPIDNLEDHATAAVAEYEKLLKQYPDYKVKIEQGLGFGIASFRSKYKFRYQNQYRHHF